MSYPMDLDETPEDALRAEITRRSELRARGLCDYCERPATEPACRFPGRHGYIRVQSRIGTPFATGTTWISLPPAPLTLDKLRAMLKEAPHPQSIVRLVPLESLRPVLAEIDAAKESDR